MFVCLFVAQVLLAWPSRLLLHREQVPVDIIQRMGDLVHIVPPALPACMTIGFVCCRVRLFVCLFACLAAFFGFLLLGWEL